MNGETVLMAIKTIYGIVAYTGTLGLLIIWIGIAIASIGADRPNHMWVMAALSCAGYMGLFVMLSITATGNNMFGMDVNAWINRTFGCTGVIFGLMATTIYLRRRWERDEAHRAK
jgi:hypothetical protein